MTMQKTDELSKIQFQFRGIESLRNSDYRQYKFFLSSVQLLFSFSCVIEYFKLNDEKIQHLDRKHFLAKAYVSIGFMKEIILPKTHQKLLDIQTSEIDGKLCNKQDCEPNTTELQWYFFIVRKTRGPIPRTQTPFLACMS